MSTISRISSAPCGQTHCGPQIYPISRPRTALPSLFYFLVVKWLWRRQLVSAATLIDSWWNLECLGRCAFVNVFFFREEGDPTSWGNFHLRFFLEGVKIIPRYLRKCRSLFIFVFLKVSLTLSALSQGTLVLQHRDLCRTKDRISCALPPDFLPDPFVFSSFLRSGPRICCSNTWLKFGQVNEKSCSIDIPLHPLWNLIMWCIKCSCSMGKRSRIGV